MTTHYLIMCINENELTPCCEYVSQTLENAKTQMALCVTNYITEGQTKFPSATFSYQTSSDGIASVVIMENNNTRRCIINGTTYPEISIINTRQEAYAKMYIVTVTQ